MQCLLNRSCLLYGVSIKGGSTVLKNTEWEYGSKELTGVQGSQKKSREFERIQGNPQEVIFLIIGNNYC